MINHDSRELTIRQKWYGPVVYFRRATPDTVPGTYRWTMWRKANDSVRNMATVKLMELNK